MTSTTRRTLCDSNYMLTSGISFAPLVAIGHADGSVTVINTACPRGRGYAYERYQNLAAAAKARSFVRRWAIDWAARTIGAGCSAG